MISAETHKRLKSNGSWNCSRGVDEKDIFKCKFCGSSVTWFKSTKEKVYPVDCNKIDDRWIARVFMGNHFNSSPCHNCREVKQ